VETGGGASTDRGLKKTSPNASNNEKKGEGMKTLAESGRGGLSGGKERMPVARVRGKSGERDRKKTKNGEPREKTPDMKALRGGVFLREGRSLCRKSYAT